MARASKTPGKTGVLAALAAVSLVALAVVPYLGTPGHPMLHDDRTLLDNRWLREEAGTGTVFAHHYWHGSRHADSDLYRPLTILTLAWNVDSDSPRLALRLNNLLLHACVTVLVWLVLRLVLVRMAGDGLQKAAWAGAALFAVHPLGSEAVLFAVGRAELLAAAFSLAAFLCLLTGMGEGRWRLFALCASPLLFFLALCSKESAATWIAILAVFWVCHRIAGAVPRFLLAGIGGWAAALLAFLFLRGSVVGWLPHTPPWIDNPLVLEGPVARAANALGLHARYLVKMIWPETLSVDHGFDQTAVLPLLPWGVAAALVAVAGWLCIAVLMKRTSPAALFLWTFVAAAFAVTGNFFFPIGTIFAERLAYLPLIGLCGLAGLLLCRYFRSTAAVAVILLLLAGAGSIRTATRGAELQDHTTFVEATADSSPRAVKALVNAGRSRLRLGDAAGAADLLQRAVEIWPEYRRALFLLGDTYERLGDRSKAEEFRMRAERAAASTAR